MNNNIAETIVAACENALERGYTICHGGPWLEFKGKKIVSVDPIAAVILTHDKMPDLDPTNLEQMSKPGLVAIACGILGVDGFWLHRFWMGYDRGHQIYFQKEKEGKVISRKKDEVSQFGIQLARMF
jgi:hypothetical protein